MKFYVWMIHNSEANLLPPENKRIISIFFGDLTRS